MLTSEDCKERALDCEERAQHAPDLEREQRLFSLAVRWRELAADDEQETRIAFSRPLRRGLAAVNDRPETLRAEARYYWEMVHYVDDELARLICELADALEQRAGRIDRRATAGDAA